MKKIPISEFKNKCIAILNTLDATKESLLITNRGRPLATVAAYRKPRRKKQLGTHAGLMQISCDLVEASSTDDWDMLK